MFYSWNSLSDQTKERLLILKTDDGFKIVEKDLEMKGDFGTNQSEYQFGNFLILVLIKLILTRNWIPKS